MKTITQTPLAIGRLISRHNQREHARFVRRNFWPRLRAFAASVAVVLVKALIGLAALGVFLSRLTH